VPTFPRPAAAARHRAVIVPGLNIGGRAGKLDLDQPLHTLLPEFTPTGVGPDGRPHRWGSRKAITVRHRLPHSRRPPAAALGPWLREARGRSGGRFGIC
jgi:hypothetical protein